MITPWDDGQSELTECYNVVPTSHNEGGENQSEGSRKSSPHVLMIYAFNKEHALHLSPFRLFNCDTKSKWLDCIWGPFCCHGWILDLGTHVWYT